MKKLKRGLKDISPIFRDDSKATVPQESMDIPIPVPQVNSAPSEAVDSVESAVLKIEKPAVVDCSEFITITNMCDDGDSFMLNAYLATQATTLNYSSALLTLKSAACEGSAGFRGDKQGVKMKQHLRHYSLDWDEIDDVFDRWVETDVEQYQPEHRYVFLDFSHKNGFYFKHVATLLDKWVLLLDPDMDSLCEGYKIMKAALQINPNLEFYVIFEYNDRQAVCGEVFLAFQEYVAEYLQINVNYLGVLNFNEEGVEKGGQQAVWDSFFSKSKKSKNIFEKTAMTHWIESHRMLIGETEGARV